MPEPITSEMLTPEAPKAEEKKVEAKTEMVEAKVTESAEELAHKLRNKEDEAARLHKKLDKFEAEEEERKRAAMSETDKIKADLLAAQTKARELETKQAQRDIAEKVGLPSAFADRIKGETPEAMEADAKALLDAMPKGTRKPVVHSSTPDGAAPGSTDEDRRKFLFG